jgi:hypothetical protein
MEPEIACQHCGTRVRLARARRIAGRVELRCAACGEVGTWPTTAVRTDEAHDVDDAPARPAPPWT